MDAVLTARHLSAGTGQPQVSFELGEGLTLLHTLRESSATALALTLAGRRRPASGTVTLKSHAGAVTSPRRIAPHVALAGSAEIDSLERLAPVREVVREQVAWASHWYRRVPRAVQGHELVEPWLDPLGLNIGSGISVGDLDVDHRFRLRVLLALIARPHASLLIVDDIDQVRALTVRDSLLRALKQVSKDVPVTVMSVNPDECHISDQVVDLRGELTAALTKREA